VGDEVVLDLQGRRLKGVADGETVTITGFSELHQGRTHGVGVPPGLWRNYSYATFRDERGGEYEVPTSEMKPLPGREYVTLHRELIRELPNTYFWEDDEVEIYDGRRGRVSVIDYVAIENPDLDRPPFRVDLARGYENLHARAIDLIERGNVWRYYNGEALAFENALDEAAFYQKASLVTHAVNPDSGRSNFQWVEAVQALRDGRADAIWNWTHWNVVVADPGGWVGCFSIDDSEVGDRLRERLLEEIEAQAAPTY
jgi:hypothetical protein